MGALQIIVAYNVYPLLLSCLVDGYAADHLVSVCSRLLSFFLVKWCFFSWLNNSLKSTEMSCLFTKICSYNCHQERWSQTMKKHQTFDHNIQTFFFCCTTAYPFRRITFLFSNVTYWHLRLEASFFLYDMKKNGRWPQGFKYQTIL